MSYYIKCFNEREATKCQRNLFELGYDWVCGEKDIYSFFDCNRNNRNCIFIIAENNKKITWNYDADGKYYTLNNCPLFKKFRLELE